MLNKIVLCGRLVRKPELKRTPAGAAVASFTLAVNRDFKSQSGETEVDFIDIVAWKATAEFAAKYLEKGRQAIVEGRLQIRNWEAKDGSKRKSAEVVADHVYFGDSKPSGAAPAPAPAGHGESVSAEDFTDITGEEDDDLPW